MLIHTNDHQLVKDGKPFLNEYLKLPLFETEGGATQYSLSDITAIDLSYIKTENTVYYFVGEQRVYPFSFSMFVEGGIVSTTSLVFNFLQCHLSNKGFKEAYSFDIENLDEVQVVLDETVMQFVDLENEKMYMFWDSENAEICHIKNVNGSGIHLDSEYLYNQIFTFDKNIEVQAAVRLYAEARLELYQRHWQQHREYTEYCEKLINDLIDGSFENLDAKQLLELSNKRLPEAGFTNL